MKQYREGRRQDLDGVVHNLCMVHRIVYVCMGE